MAYNLTSLRNRVLDDKLDDTDFSPSIVDRFINDTQRSIFNTYELPFMEKVFEGTMSVGGTIYNFPTDYQLQQSFVIVSPEGSVSDISDLYMDFREFNRAYPTPADYDAGTPTAWTVHGNKLYLNRPTDQEYTLSLFYLKKPDELEDGADVPELPSEWEELLVLGAYIRVLQRNEDFDLAAYYETGPYAVELDKLVGRLGKRQTGIPTVMGQPRRRGGVRNKNRA